MTIRALFWLFGVVILAGVLAILSITGRFAIRTDLMALLPSPQRDPVSAAAMQHMSGFGERRVVFLVSGDNKKNQHHAVRALADTLKDSSVFKQVITNADDVLSADQRTALKHLYFTHRFHLLAPDDAAALDQLAREQPDSAAARHAREHFLGRAHTRLYGFAPAGEGRFIDDPLGLSDAYRQAATPSIAPGLRLAGDGSLYVSGQKDQRYAVIFAQTRADPFAFSVEQQATKTLDKARHAAHRVAPQAQIIASGVLLHASAAAQRARFEMSVIGTGSLLGIVLLTFWAFRSLRAFVLSLAAIGGGVLLAMVTTDLVFGSVHMLTLVFGASLVGVAIDYCMHFFAQRLDTPEPATALAHIRRPVALGLVTSVIAYGGMVIAPFPGLRQIGIFTATGLIGAWLGMMLLLPGACGRRPPRAGTALRLARLWRLHGPARLFSGHKRSVVGVLVVLTAAFGTYALFQLSAADDVRVLYNPPPELMHADQSMARLLGTTLSTQAIVVQGQTPDGVLREEGKIVDELAAHDEPRSDLRAITEAYPPVSVQKRNYRELANTLYAPHGPVSDLLAKAGFKTSKIAATIARFRSAHGHTLKLSDWLASPASQGLRGLWLGQVDGHYASLIRLQKVANKQALKSVLSHHPEAQYINRVSRISGLMAHYRRLASVLLGVEYVLAWLVLWRAFGARGALVLLLAPACASTTVLALFTLSGAVFSLFNLIALILLLGLGADYGIFLRTAPREHAPAMLAVGLSMATTLLAFGLLALSKTPALHEFGITLAVGLLLTFLFSSALDARAGNAANMETRDSDARRTN